MLKRFTSLFPYIQYVLFLNVIMFATPLYAGEATLEWNPPSTNTDGTVLDDLSGYVIYYGNASGDYPESIDVGNVTSYKVTGLTDDMRYYFAVTAYDTSGNESTFSNEIFKTIEPVYNPVPDITVVDPEGSESDLQMSFGDLTENLSLDKTVTIRNDGTEDLNIGSIAVYNPVAEPFSIIFDNCSGQTLTPASSCSFTVSFSPITIGVFWDNFDIPSDDPDENSVKLKVAGNGLDSSVNNPPTIPTPVAPVSGEKVPADTVEFRWKKSIDPDLETITYYLYYSNDSDFGNSTPLKINSLGQGDNVEYAGLDNFTAALMLSGFIPVFVNIARKNRKYFVVMLITVMMGMLLTSCGKKITDYVPFLNNSSSDEVSQVVSGLHAGTTYCWMVVAEDEGREQSESGVNCFETE